MVKPPGRKLSGVPADDGMPLWMPLSDVKCVKCEGIHTNKWFKIVDGDSLTYCEVCAALAILAGDDEMHTARIKDCPGCWIGLNGQR